MLVRVLRALSVRSYETSFGTGTVSLGQAYVGEVVLYHVTATVTERDDRGRPVMYEERQDFRWIEGFSDLGSYPREGVDERRLSLLVGVPGAEPAEALALPYPDEPPADLYAYLEACAEADASLLRVEIDHDKVWERLPEEECEATANTPHTSHREEIVLEGRRIDYRS